MIRLTCPARILPPLLALTLTACAPSQPADAHAEHDHGDHHEHAGDPKPDGPDHKDHADHDHDDHDDHDSPVRFTADQGLLLSEETATALGLNLGTVAVHSIRPTYDLTAAVFTAGPPARASAWVSIDVADALAQDPPAGARLLNVHRSASPDATRAEVVFALPEPAPVGSTVRLILHGRSRDVLAIPVSALLQTATGTFVYLSQGPGLLRRPVSLGARDGAFLEILTGLSAGDAIATAGVEQLWLTELRLTKGGGHSH